MSYVVLARKYRPMRFADMIGQEHIGRTLGNAIKQDRVHHAYLFAGARGLGKTTTARIFAKGLVCEKGPTPDPCNVCSECVAVSEGRSVDVMEIDGASNNSVDNIRNLREQVHYLPQTARRKVYIIDEVHMLTTSAFNALLKTLEEPPPHVNFVFATTEPQKVLPTILSRVNRLDFKRVSPGQLAAYLGSILEREGLSVEEGGLRIVARAGGGSVRDALTLLDQVIAFAEDPKAVGEEEVRRLLGQADAGAVHELVGSILDRDATATMQRFDALVVGGHDLSVLSLQVLEHLRDLAVIRVCDSPSVMPDATEAELAALRAQAGKVPASHLGQLFDRFSRVIDRLPQSRTQRLLIEMGLLDLACAEPVIPLGDLVDRLHALGRGAAPASGGGGGGRGGASRGAGGGRSSAPSRGRSARADDGGFVPPTPPSFEPSQRGSRAGTSSDEPSQRGSRAETSSFEPSQRGSRAETSSFEPSSRGSRAETSSDEPSSPPSVEPGPRAGTPSPRQARAESTPSSPPFASGPRGGAPEPPPFDDVPHPAAFEAPPDRGAPPPRARPAEPPSFEPGPPPSFDSGPPPSFEPGPPAGFQGARSAPGRTPPTEPPRAAPARPAPAPEPPANSFTAKLLDMALQSGVVTPGGGEPSGDGDREAPPQAGPAHGPGTNGASRPGSNGTAQASEVPRMGVGPCLPPPPADGVIPFEELSAFEAWEQLVGRIRTQDEFLSAVLGEVGLVELAGGTLRIASPRGSFAHTELTRHPQVRAQIEQACRDDLGAPFTVELVEGEPVLPDLPSLVLVAQKRRAEHRAQVEAEAKAHPGIKTLLSTFDAQLLGTKPLHEP